MTRLQKLTAFLRANLPEPVFATEFSSEMDNITFKRAHNDLGEKQYQILTQEYDAVIAWGRWPYREIDTRYIPVLIEAWYQDLETDFTEPDFDDEPPTIDVDVIDDDIAMVVVTLKLSDAIVLKEDEKGLVPFDGKRWSLANPEVLFAENIDVIPRGVK
ncbi:TPA: phage tail protein [Proteus mirabilis]|uniref:phage tail protein n=1 Tax=Proteus mirabilis TaxID=584 RepID=UPI0018C7E263|nr:phage tail protein [Proteus mirabilis]MBG2954309.1 phage tail protein [Proteus mirabilis]